MDTLLHGIREYLKDPFVNLILAVIIGVLANLITERIRKRIKRIWWGVKTTSLQKSHFAETGKLRMSYKNLAGIYRKIEKDLCLSRIVFWSSGKEILLDTDISSVEPLLLKFCDDCEILEIREIKYSNKGINPEVKAPNQIQLCFEYLENNQGAVFDIVYTGESTKPDMAGVIKGGKYQIKEVSSSLFSPGSSLLSDLFSWMKPAHKVFILRGFSTIGLIFLLWVLLNYAFIVTNPYSELGWILFFRIFLALIIYLMFSIWVWRIAVVPRNLEAFYSPIE